MVWPALRPGSIASGGRPSVAGRRAIATAADEIAGCCRLAAAMVDEAVRGLLLGVLRSTHVRSADPGCKQVPSGPGAETRRSMRPGLGGKPSASCPGIPRRLAEYYPHFRVKRLS